MIDVTMPRLSDGMEEGTILKWLAAAGASVDAGDELAEIETDKASTVYEAEAGGVLHPVVQEGETVAVGAPIAHLLAAGEAAPTSPAAPSSPVALSPVMTSAGGRIAATPLARRIAAELGIDLETLAGSGPRGRIVRADVEAAPATPEAPEAAPSATPTPTATALAEAARASDGAKGATREVALTRLQRAVARRMAEAKATVPDFQVRMQADITELLALRAELRATGDVSVSVNDFVVKACAAALRAHPRANASIEDDTIFEHDRINVGVAVAGEGTLVVPTVFDADRASVGEIGRRTRRLAAAVRDGSIAPADLSGGTFTVSNLGMFGVTEFTAVVNPGQAAILAVGAAAKAPVYDGEGFAARDMMALTLSADHRILYGADAAAFLGAVTRLLEAPLALIVG